MLDTQTKLDAWLPSLESADWLAVDTEADSLHAYPEKVCLIQVSTRDGDRLIDTLSHVDLGGFFAAISRHELIMHGADYDLRLLRKHYAFTPKAVFDTMLAARLVGLRQFSLGHLVERYLGVKLEKGPQKANWALRPLTPRMESYARNDTHYLRALETRLRAELKAQGRLGWHRESCARLIEEANREPQNHEDPWRLRGSTLLGRQGMAVLRELWRWREREAIASNRPPFFILSHDALVMIADAAASRRPVDPLLPRHLTERRRGGLIKALNRALSLEPEHWPKPLRFLARRPSEGEKRKLAELRKRRDAAANSLGLDPTLIASRAMLSDLAHEPEKQGAELMSWQRELLFPK